MTFNVTIVWKMLIGITVIPVVNFYLGSYG
jgi:hypothetical protein